MFYNMVVKQLLLLKKYNLTSIFSQIILDINLHSTILYLVVHNTFNK